MSTAPPSSALTPTAGAPAFRAPAADGVQRVVQDPVRLAAVRATGLLDAPAEAAFDRLAALAAKLLRTPLATVTLVDADRQFYTACVGLPEPLATARQTGLDVSFCRLTVADAALGALPADGALAIPDTRLDPRTRDMASVTVFGVHAYAGVPLVVDGQPVGTLCVMDVRPRAWTPDEREVLAELGRSVTSEVELRAANRRLAAQADALAAANQTKAQFLANMSHELRTPLNAIGGYVQLLDMGLHGPVTGEQRDALGRVQKAQARLLSLINDILNYAKLESGRVEYDLAAVDVADVIGDVAPLVEPQMRAKGLAFDVRLPDTPCVVWADREKLGQVLVNLLSNAVKFTGSPRAGSPQAGSPDAAPGEPGRVAVRVSTRLPATVFLRVADSGVGIPPDKQASIFEPFVQVRARHAGNYAQATEGTGLGLAISRDLARGMGGDLRVRSREGVGSTFTVALRRVVLPA